MEEMILNFRFWILDSGRLFLVFKLRITFTYELQEFGDMAIVEGVDDKDSQDDDGASKV